VVYGGLSGDTVAVTVDGGATWIMSDGAAEPAFGDACVPYRSVAVPVLLQGCELPLDTAWVGARRVVEQTTLIHELGHAVHSMLAGHHSILTQQPSLPLAETASVFAEMLLTDRLLRQERDPMARRELLAASLDDIYATVLRQSYFVRFEIAAHRAVLEGRSTEDLNELYLAQLREQFGEVGEGLR